MVEVVLSVEKVSALIAEIAQASQEQSSGIGQVNTAIAQMERVVERNAALVDQATQATEAMNAQAAGLLDLARRFKLGAEEAVRAAPPAAASPAPIRFTPAPKLPPAPPARPRGKGEWASF
jgi:uncharacterized coiled-coil protein SlyX